MDRIAWDDFANLFGEDGFKKSDLISLTSYIDSKAKAFYE